MGIYPHFRRPKLCQFPSSFKHLKGHRIQKASSCISPANTRHTPPARMKAPKSKKTHQENLPPSSSNSTLSSQPTFPAAVDDDDDFQDPFQSIPLTQITLNRKQNSSSLSKSSFRVSSTQPLKPSNSSSVCRPSKKPKRLSGYAAGQENLEVPAHSLVSNTQETQIPYAPIDLGLDVDCSLESIEPTIDCSRYVEEDAVRPSLDIVCSVASASSLTEKADISVEKVGLQPKGGCKYVSNSIESRLLRSNLNCPPVVCDNDSDSDEENFEPGTQLDVLLKLCSEADGQFNQLNSSDLGGGFVQCPMCGVDISGLSEELRHVHTNECLDKGETPSDVTFPDNDPRQECPGQVLNISPSRAPAQIVDVSPVLHWLRGLGLARYEDAFSREEIDWDSLQWLTEEDLCSIGVTALGPRKKIVHALSELRKEGTKAVENHADASAAVDGETSKLAPTKLITDYFPGFTAANKRVCTTSTGRNEISKSRSKAVFQAAGLKSMPQIKISEIFPCGVAYQEHHFEWYGLSLVLSIVAISDWLPDAFKYLRRDCFHWFLTHFHTDHYQGLTKSFCHGKIYCSLITAKLVNLKIGIPWDKLEILPLNQKISISGIDVTCFDANHCPGSIIILFEPPSGKAVLHTGDFRFSEEMAKMSILQTCPIHTLILDTTYCDPQYDFPKQEAVIQFVIEAIQAESFNPKTLFLIGSYTIGKERLFLEVARVLQKKVYVPAAKLRLLESLGIAKEDMQWFTVKEHESQIHVVPMWTLASFKRLKHISNQYMNRFSLIVAFSPTGWTFGKGKKSSPGRRWQQGTIIRYEVPYSEHCSFTELREFVKFISPMNIIPSVNNHGPESSSSMISLLSS